MRIGVYGATLAACTLWRRATPSATKTVISSDLSFYDEGAARVGGHFGLATNHDAEKAIPRAQMSAMKYVLHANAANLPAVDDEAAPADFLRAGPNFADAATIRCDQEKLDLRDRDNVIAAVEASLNPLLPGLPRGRRRNAPPGSVWLRKKRPSRSWKTRRAAPDGFSALFFHGGEDRDERRLSSWHQAFVLFAAKALKGDDKKFAAIFTATRLATAAGASLDASEAAQVAAALSKAIGAAVLDSVRQIDRIEKLLVAGSAADAAGHAATHDLRRDIQARFAARQGVETKVLESIFRVLGKLDVSLDEMRSQAEQAVAEIAGLAAKAPGWQTSRGDLAWLDAPIAEIDGGAK